MSGAHGSDIGTYGNESVRPDSGDPFQQGIHDGDFIEGWQNVCLALWRLAVEWNLTECRCERADVEKTSVLFCYYNSVRGKGSGTGCLSRDRKK